MVKNSPNVNGFENIPVNNLPIIAIKYKNAPINTCLLQKSFIGIANPIVHAKNILNIHSMICTKH